MKRNILILFIILILAYNSKAQEGIQIDSLKKEIKRLFADDITTVDLLNEISKKYRSFEPDSTIKYAEIALRIGIKINYHEGNAKAYRMKGIGFSRKSDYDNALKQFFLALDEAEKANDINYMAIIYTSIGIVYRKRTEPETALTYYLKSLEILKIENKPAKVSSALNNIGIIYKIIGNHDKAIQYYSESFKINKEINNREGMAFPLANIGILYKKKEEFDKAIKVLTQALDIFKEFNLKPEVGKTYTELGEIYLLKENYQKAFNCIQISYKTSMEISNRAGEAESLLTLGNIYLKQGKYTVAKSAIYRGLEIVKDIDKKEFEIDAYLSLSELHSEIRDFEKAFFYYKKYTNLKDSVFSNENNKAISEILENYNNAEKEKENLILKKNKQINYIKIKRQKTINIFISTALIMLSLFVLVIFFAYKKLKSSNYLLSNRNEEIGSQNSVLEEYKEKITSQYSEIRKKNEELSKYKDQLEDLVKERTSDLHKALDEAKKSDSLKTEFLQNLSHEIRTPLNAISGFSSIILDKKRHLEPKHLYSVRKSMDDLLRTINRLIVFSKLKIGEYKLNTEKIKLQDLFEKLELDLFKRKAFLNKENIKIYFNINYHVLPKYFLSDFYILSNIITEIIENAFKFTNKGNITVTVKMQGKNNLCVSIKDTGIGMKKEILPQIFDFFRKFDGEDQLYRGMGVGLALVKKAVQILKGEIKIDSIPEEGTEFKIYIPEIKA